MAKHEKIQEMTVVAQLSLTSPAGEEIIKSFDKAWHRAFELPTPVIIKLLGFVRKDA